LEHRYDRDIRVSLIAISNELNHAVNKGKALLKRDGADHPEDLTGFERPADYSLLPESGSRCSAQPKDIFASFQ
jgi:hypothetical protein